MMGFLNVPSPLSATQTFDTGFSLLFDVAEDCSGNGEAKHTEDKTKAAATTKCCLNPLNHTCAHVETGNMNLEGNCLFSPELKLAMLVFFGLCLNVSTRN